MSPVGRPEREYRVARIPVVPNKQNRIRTRSLSRGMVTMTPLCVKHMHNTHRKEEERTHDSSTGEMWWNPGRVIVAVKRTLDRRDRERYLIRPRSKWVGSGSCTVGPTVSLVPWGSGDVIVSASGRSV